MARRTLIWHIGLADPPRPVLTASLARHRAALEERGVRVVADADEARLATHELLRTHRQAGLARQEVEGCWARICDRIWQHKGVSLLSTPDLGAAEKDQVRLALAPLIGVEVHLVVTADSLSQQLYGGWLAELRAGRTTGWEKYVGRVLAHAVEGTEHRQAEQFWAGHELASMVARWGRTFHADRLHVVAEQDLARQWAELLDLAGIADDGLAAGIPPYADPAGVAVLRKVNRQVDEAIGQVPGQLLAGADQDRAAMPVAATTALAPLVERWSATLARAGHDVRGDLAALVEEGTPRSLPGARDQLGVAVDALADVLADNRRLRGLVTDLEAERERLDRKRRSWKRRAKEAAAG